MKIEIKPAEIGYWVTIEHGSKRTFGISDSDFDKIYNVIREVE